MADINDPFTPGVIPASAEQGGQFEQLKGQWDSFLGDPRNLAAIGSIGMALSQPLRWGDTGFSHASRAIGAGGESVRLSDELKRKEEEAASKEELRSAQATAAEARAAAAGARAGAAGESLGLKQQALDLKERQFTLQQQLKASLGYGAYIAGIDKANQKVEAENTKRELLGQPKLPAVQKLDRDEWIRQQTFLGNLPTNVGGTQTVPSAGGRYKEGDVAEDPSDPTKPPLVYRGGQWVKQ